MTWSRRTRVVAGVLTAALCTLVAACGGPGPSGPGECAAPADDDRLAIATGNTTGVYYILGGGVASVLGDNLDKTVANAEATAASVENIHLVCSGDTDIAFSLGDTAAAAVQGTGPFESDQKPVRALARLYVDVTHVMVRADAGIESVSDLQGKRVSTGSPNSGTEFIAERLLRENGLDPDSDIGRQRLATGESVDAMKDGALDAIIHVGTFPHPGMQDLTASMEGDVTMLDVGKNLDPLNEAYDDIYVPATVPASTYDTPGDVETVGVPTMLLVSGSMPDEEAYRLTKTIFEHMDDLAEIHPAAADVTPQNATHTRGVDLHPGAQRYFEEVGRSARGSQDAER